MRSTHCRPLNGTPVHHEISLAHDNCYGAVLDALYAFWSARATTVARTGGERHDAYSIVLFNKDIKVNRSALRIALHSSFLKFENHSWLSKTTPACRQLSYLQHVFSIILDMAQITAWALMKRCV